MNYNCLFLYVLVIVAKTCLWGILRVRLSQTARFVRDLIIRAHFHQQTYNGQTFLSPPLFLGLHRTQITRKHFSCFPAKFDLPHRHEK